MPVTHFQPKPSLTVGLLVVHPAHAAARLLGGGGTACPQRVGSDGSSEAQDHDAHTHAIPCTHAS
jgi:hypothetical protein